MNNIINFICFPHGDKSGDYSFPFSLCSLKRNNLSFNKSTLKSFLHTSAILNSDPRNHQPNNLEASSSNNPSSQPINLEASSSNDPRSPIFVEVERLDNERLSNLQLTRYQGTPTTEEEVEED
jgi:hypothetical protein